MSEIFTEKMYRKGTEVSIMIAVLFYAGGIPVIPIVSNAIFSKTDVSVGLAVQLCSVASLIGACISPFIIQYIKIKNILLGGYVISAVFLLIITCLFGTNHDEAAFWLILILTVIYMVTMGGYSFPYIAAIGSANQVSVANAGAWITYMIVQTLLQVDANNVAVNFGVFGILCVLSILYVHFVLKHTEGMAYDQLKKMYYPEDLMSSQAIVYNNNSKKGDEEPINLQDSFLDEDRA